MDELKKLSPSINNFLLTAIIYFEQKFSNSPFGPSTSMYDSVPRGRKEDHFSAMVNLSLQASIYRLPPTSILKLCKQGFVTSKVKWKKREMPLKHQTDLGSNILKKSDGGGTWIERVAKELRMSVSERITNWKDIMREGTPATITQMMQSLLSYIISFETEIDTKDLKGLKVQIRIPLT